MVKISKKLVDAPSFGHTSSHQVGSSWDSKFSKHSDDLKYDLYTTQECPKAEKLVIAWFKMQVRAKMW